MPAWHRELSYNPLPFLLLSGSAPIALFTRHDLLDEEAGSARVLWAGAEVKRILARQKPDGRWSYLGGGNARIRSTEDYDQLETFRQLGILVEEYGLDRSHPHIRNAARFLFTHQTEEGDFRGIYGRQYSPNYSAGLVELLLKAGYGGDRRIERDFRWLLSMRQTDGLSPAGRRRAPQAGVGRSY